MKVITKAVASAVVPFVKRLRSSRRPLTQIPDPGPYRLPRQAQDRLLSRIHGVRNAEAVFLLATFLARHHATPHRIGQGFCIDRRALSGHEKLGLTQARVRGAIRVLVEAGFIEPVSEKGSGYRATESGLRKRPLQFVFCAEFLAIFQAAVSRNQRHATRREIGAPYLAQRNPTGKPLHMGQIRIPHSPTPNSVRNEKLETALFALQSAIAGAGPVQNPVK